MALAVQPEHHKQMGRLVLTQFLAALHLQAVAVVVVLPVCKQDNRAALAEVVVDQTLETLLLQLVELPRHLDKATMAANGNFRTQAAVAVVLVRWEVMLAAELVATVAQVHYLVPHIMQVVVVVGRHQVLM